MQAYATAQDPPDTEPHICVVVLNWHSWRRTIVCLGSIRSQEYRNWSAIVIENGSGDSSWEKLAAWVQKDNSISRDSDHSLRFELLRSDVNLGFAAGCNFGIWKALSLGAKYVLLLNNDARLDSECIAKLVRVAIARDAGIVGARVMDEHGQVMTLSGKWPRRLFWSYSGIGTAPDQESWEVSEASGAAMLVRDDVMKERMHQSGYVLDPSLFMYGEDTDLCRYARSRNWGCSVARDALVYHVGGGSSNGVGSCRSYYYITRNRVFLVDRWLGVGARMLFHLYFVPSRLALIAIRAIAGRRNCPHAVLSGLFDAYRSIRGEWVHHDAPVGAD